MFTQTKRNTKWGFLSLGKKNGEKSLTVDVVYSLESRVSGHRVTQQFIIFLMLRHYVFIP